MKILVPVDGSDYSRAAVEFVASRSTLIGTEPQVELINVQLAVPVRAARVVGKSTLSEYYESDSAKVLKPALRRLQKAGLNATARYLVGNPGEEISAAAIKGGVDLIVMGAHGHTARRGRRPPAKQTRRSFPWRECRHHALAPSPGYRRRRAKSPPGSGPWPRLRLPGGRVPTSSFRARADWGRGLLPMRTTRR